MDRSNPAERVAAHHREGRGVTRIGYPIEVRRARVARSAEVTPYMLRLTLTGDELAGFHNYVADDHVKIVFPMPDGTRNDPVPGKDQMLDWPRPMAPTRTYTIRRYDAAVPEIDLDVVRHAGGLASTWAEAAQSGDEAVIAGPPGAKAFGHTFRHYVFAVDTTGLPAVARWLEEADWLAAAGATGHVLIDHDHPEETAYPLTDRPGVEVRWLSRSGGSRLVDEVASLPLPDVPAGDVFVFAAGEASDTLPLRDWVTQRGHEASVTGYWKRGVRGHDE